MQGKNECREGGKGERKRDGREVRDEREGR